MPVGHSMQSQKVELSPTFNTGELISALKDIGKHVSAISKGYNLNEYLKESDELAHDLSKAFADYNHEVSQYGSAMEGTAQTLLKVYNAIAGADQAAGGKGELLVGEFATVKAVINDVIRDAGRLDDEFSALNFASLFTLNEQFKDARYSLKSLLDTMSKAGQAEELSRQLARNRRETEWIRGSAQEAQDQVAALSDTVANLQQQLNSSSDHKLQQKLIDEQVEKFRASMVMYDIDPQADFLKEYVEKIKSGASTALEALRKVRAEHENLFSGDGHVSAGMEADAEQLALLSQQLQTVIDKLNELSEIIKAGPSIDGSAAFQNIAKIFQSVSENSEQADASVNKAGSSITSVLTKLSELLNGASEIKLTSLAALTTGLAALNKVSINKSLRDGLPELIQSIDPNKIVSLREIADVDFSKWNNVRVSAQSLKALAEWLPFIADVNASKLQKVGNVDLSALINSVKHLDLKDLDSSVGTLNAALDVMIKSSQADEAAAKALLAENELNKALEKEQSSHKKTSSQQKDTTVADGVKAYKEYINLQQQHYALRLKIRKADNGSQTRQQLEGQDAELKVRLAAAKQAAQQYDNALKQAGRLTEQTDKLKEAEDRYKQNLKDVNAAQQDSLSKALDVYDDGSKWRAKVDTTTSAWKELESRYAELRTKLAQPMTKPELDTATQEWDNLRKAMDEYAATSKRALLDDRVASKSSLTYDKLTNKLLGYYHQFESAISKNPKLMSQYQSTLNSLQTQQFGGRMTDAAQAVQRFQIECDKAGITSNAFIKRLISGFGNKIFYGGLATLASYVRRLATQAVKSVADVDAAMTQLRIVTDATDAEMTQFFERASALASKLGQSVTGVLGSIETFSRLGYNLGDASTLAEYATILSNVANVDVSEATTGLTSILKGYGMQVSESEHIADVLVEVGQKYAISASELLSAFERGGAALSASGTSFEKSAAIFAAANASVQNADTVGTAMKTVSARIRGSKTELEELGEEYEDVAHGISKYREELMALTNVDGTGGFDIMTETGNYKDIYDIYTGIAAVWNKMSDASQARAAEILGGTRQLSVISSTISNIADAAGAYGAAMDSAGTANEANEKYISSINGRIGQLKADAQNLASSLINSDLLKYGLQLLDIVVKIVDGLADVKVLLPGILGVITTINSVGEPKHEGFLECAHVSSGGDTERASIKYDLRDRCKGALEKSPKLAYWRRTIKYVREPVWESAAKLAA